MTATTQADDPARRVKNGLQTLDTAWPGWADHIDLPRLAPCGLAAGVLAQLVIGRPPWTPRRLVGVTVTPALEVACGFTPALADLASRDTREVLTELYERWRAAITARQARSHHPTAAGVPLAVSAAG